MRRIGLAQGAVFTGTLAAVLGAAAPPPAGEPRVLLVHLDEPRDASPRADRPAARSLLLTDTASIIDAPDGAAAIAVSLPLARIGATPLAPATTLTQTPLVRASRALLESLAIDLRAGGDTPPRALDDALVHLLRGILREHPRTAAPDSPDASLWVRLESAVDARHTDPRLDVAQLARELHTSRRQLYRHVAGGGVAAMIARRRVATAQELLDQHPMLSVRDVAIRSGFASAPRLRAQFLRVTGTTPTEWRRRGRQPGQDDARRGADAGRTGTRADEDRP